MKGIILAAGQGTRLYPMTKPIGKPLLPVYDKPMLYYPLAALLEAGIQEILILTPPGQEQAFTRLLGDGSQLGVRISYAVQPEMRGIADALLLGAEFLAGDRVCLVLGDNVFYDPNFRSYLRRAKKQKEGATIFACYQEDPRPFGVVELGHNDTVVSLEEKPAAPKSNYIVPGIYFYDQHAPELAKELTPSDRGMLEITDLNLAYMHHSQLHVIVLDREFTWLDAGTAEGLLAAANAVRNIQQETGQYVACLEEIAMNRGLLSRKRCQQAGEAMKNTAYGQYLLRAVQKKKK